MFDGGMAMAFIKTQKLRRIENGTIISGTASIVVVKYVKGKKHHSKQCVVECLGKILYLHPDGKSGIFMSPTRGLVEYDVVSDEFHAVEKDDSRISQYDIFPVTDIHTVFGDVFLILKFLEKSSLINVFRTVFLKNIDFERVLCHVIHGIARDGSKITCDNYISKSFASYVLSDVPVASLKSDTNFFTLMGEDKVKLAFFRTFITTMRQTNPSFGKGCYVDSTPLPNDIEDNPFNALCSHGVGMASVQMRLILVLDENTGLPVWYDIIPGNVLDINTVMTVVNDVAASLDIEIDSLVLDAGYVSKELITAFHIGTKKSIIGRMPARKGFPYKELYWEFKDQISKGKYTFIRNRHAYFGKCKEIELFEHNVFAYVYVDKNNALQRYRDYLSTHEEEYAKLTDKDKDWMTVEHGYFVLVSNLEKTPTELLTDYFARTDIETVFKTSKEYLGLLPLSKWTIQTVRGKILHDLINTIILLLLRKHMDKTGISITELFGRTQSLMCFRNDKGIVTVETPNKITKEYYGLLDLTVPSHVDICEFRNGVLQLK